MGADKNKGGILMSNLACIDDTKIWTYEDVQKLNNGNRYELIDGTLYMLASPSTMHQKISGEIFGQIREYLKGKSCEVYFAPMDVNFEKKLEKSNNFVQPDIFVICDKNKKRKNQILGTPDFIVEIISPKDELKDRFEKLNLYFINKVKEYWIVDPIKKRIDTYILKDKKYIWNNYKITEKIKVSIFDSLEIDVSGEYKRNEYLLREEDEEYIIEDFEVSDILKKHIMEITIPYTEVTNKL